VDRQADDIFFQDADFIEEPQPFAHPAHAIPGDAARTYPSGDADAMAAAIIDLVDDPEGRERSVAAAAKVVDGLAWDRVKADYLALVDSLAGGSPEGRPAGAA